MALENCTLCRGTGWKVVPQPTDERVRTLMKDLERVAHEDPRKDLFSKAGV
ncbi:MAG TPA: hypothetical protein VM709_12605 [Candidatus Sulfotelmatobacter sp.]|nr:hypothetical protein [Candidatus Sulfotelmatobacter sp.]